MEENKFVEETSEKKENIAGEEHTPGRLAPKQMLLFTVLLSFTVSVVGTFLTMGILGQTSGMGGALSDPMVFNRPKIVETITQKEISELILRQDDLVVEVVEKSSPAVVSIIAAKDVPVLERFYTDPFADDPFLREFFRVPQERERGTERREISSGTGFIVSPDGLIVTNKHVVSDTAAQYTAVLNNGTKKTAQVIARDPFQDLAILKIDGTGYTALKMGDSSQVKIGQTVIAIGNALGEFRNTVSVGVISGLQRNVVAQGGMGPELLHEVIQTDAAINPGNSGGPLLNLRGEVIGINTAIARGAENIGFAIPVDKAKRDLESVKKIGRIVYPFIGIRYIAVTEELARQQNLGRNYGILLVSGGDQPAVVPDSPAERAGLREGDIILELGRERIDANSTLAYLIQKYQVGDEVPLKIFRNGAETEVTIQFAERT